MVTPRPHSADGGNAMTSLATAVHVTPSFEIDAVTTFPARASLTHFGATPAPALVLVVPPFEAVRRWNASPRPSDTNIAACAAPAVSFARIITPTLAHASTPPIPATRATMAPSPSSVR